MESRFSSMPDWRPLGGAGGTVMPKPNTRGPAVQDQGQLFAPLNLRDHFDQPNVDRRFDPLDLRSRSDDRPSRLRQEINHLRLVAELRSLIRVAVQKSVCHPRGKPPHGRFGYSSVGYFLGFDADDDRGEHDGRGHDGHEPPSCPSPH
jgi:hypothetical protein